MASRVSAMSVMTPSVRISRMKYSWWDGERRDGVGKFVGGREGDVGEGRIDVDEFYILKSGFLSGANLNKTHSNPLESQREVGGIKAERYLCSQMYDWN